MPGPIDEDAFRALFAAHFDAIWSYVRRRCGSSADADDITAEVFGVLWRRHDQIAHDVAVGHWLYGVARRTLANHHRGDRRRGRLTARLEAEPTSMPQDASSAIEDLDPGIAAAVMALSEDDREILLLRAWDCWAITEIAQIVGQTPNAVSIRLHRTRKRLIAVLTKDGDGDRTLRGWTHTEETTAHE